jgi:hypothetical protein
MQEHRENSSMKVSAYLAPENEQVGKIMRSLCTNSRGVVARKDFSFGKVS